MPTDRRIVYLNPRDLLPSRQNVRSDPGDLAGLAETIREHGILQPLGVTREGDTYRIVYGNRRRDAAIVVGLDRVPCMVLDGLAEGDAVIQQVLENLQRLDLNDVDKSRAFEQLLSRTMDGGLAMSDALDVMARTLGLSSRQIQRYLRLSQLGPEVQRLIAQGEFGVTHGQHLVEIEPAERQEEVALLVIEESLSAAELARLCAALQHNANISPRAALEALRRGERIAVVEMRPKDDLQRLTATPVTEADVTGVPWDDGEKAAGEGEEVEGDDEAEDEAPQPRRAMPGREQEMGDYGRFEPTTHDGNRVRKIHTLDSFMDELQRLAVCVQEGDFQRLLGGDETGLMKTRLAVRQLRFLYDALSALVKASDPES